MIDISPFMRTDFRAFRRLAPPEASRCLATMVSRPSLAAAGSSSAVSSSAGIVVVIIKATSGTSGTGSGAQGTGHRLHDVLGQEADLLAVGSFGHDPQQRLGAGVSDHQAAAAVQRRRASLQALPSPRASLSMSTLADFTRTFSSTWG